MNLIQFMQWTCIPKFAYYSGGGLAIELVDCTSFEPIAQATVWLDGMGPTEVAIKDYSENEGMLTALLDANIVEVPLRWVDVGFVSIPVCKLTEDALALHRSAT